MTILNKERLEIYKQAKIQWGIDSQVNMAVEELAELIVALQHLRRQDSWGDREALLSVTDEIADVEIMLEQVKYMLNINSLAVFEVKEKKLARVKQLLKR